MTSSDVSVTGVYECRLSVVHVQLTHHGEEPRSEYTATFLRAASSFIASYNSVDKVIRVVYSKIQFNSDFIFVFKYNAVHSYNPNIHSCDMQYNFY